MPATQSQLREKALGIVLATEATPAVRSAAIRSTAAGLGVPTRQVRQWVREAEDDQVVPTWAKIIAVGLLVLLAWSPHLRKDIPAPLPIELLLLPLWWPATRRAPAFAPLMWLVGVALASGFWLAVWNGSDHAYTHGGMIATTSLVLSVFLGVGVILWARTVLGLRWTGVAFAVGLLMSAAQTASSGLAATNPWKFAWSLPVTLLLLSLLAPVRSRLVQVLALGGLALSGVTNDARSFFGMCLFTAGLVIWQGLPAGQPGRLRRITPAVLLAGLLALVYWGGTKLLLDGALGSGLQERSQAQVLKSGSLLAGGRPEWTATWQLMHERPLGFGLGSVPTSSDIVVAKTGLSKVLEDYDSGYVDKFMFGGAFKLHSVAADLWVNLGVLGLLLALVVAVILLGSLVRALADRTASAVVIFTTVVAVWFLAFGPIVSNLGDIGLALGLTLLVRDAPGSGAPGPEPAGHGPG
ncbi:hypothetical protein [Angustibacter luteus]|uniref:O-antigen ligase domain-containing protein n=1 Tax=Angustibacter luteus TaxID=658456 RepID=A0ABW1JB22_9ACTN